jgi:hypothetical protein
VQLVPNGTRAMAATKRPTIAKTMVSQGTRQNLLDRVSPARSATRPRYHTHV